MRGRKPIAADVKAANGNPGRRPINVNEPKYAAIGTATPRELHDRIARAEWRRIVPRLSERGHATIVDRATVIAYCLKYAQWVKLETAAASGDFLDHDGKPNPLINMANKAYALFMAAARELGLTPSQRPRVVGASSGPAPVDEFTEFARSRPSRVASHE